MFKPPNGQQLASYDVSPSTEAALTDATLVLYITQQLAYDKLIAYFSALPPSTIVGTSNLSGSCPIQKYLHAKVNADPQQEVVDHLSVCASWVRVVRQQGEVRECYIPPPRIVGKFVLRLDAIDNGGHHEVTAAEALNILYMAHDDIAAGY